MSDSDDAVNEPRAIDHAPLFAKICNERTSEAGRAAVMIAQNLFDRAFDEKDRAEARQWVKLGLDCDKAVQDGNIEAALAKVRKKAATSDKLDKARQLAAGVIPIREGV
jgi:hypothetical protein